MADDVSDTENQAPVPLPSPSASKAPPPSPHGRLAKPKSSLPPPPPRRGERSATSQPSRPPPPPVRSSAPVAAQIAEAVLSVEVAPLPVEIPVDVPPPEVTLPPRRVSSLPPPPPPQRSKPAVSAPRASAPRASAPRAAAAPTQSSQVSEPLDTSKSANAVGPLGPTPAALEASESSARESAGRFAHARARATAPATLELLRSQAEGVIAVCLAQLAQNPEKQRAARLHFELGRLYESPLGDTAKAAGHYQQGRSLQPEHIPTLNGARRTLTLLKQYQQAFPLFDEEIRLTSDPHHQAVLLYQKGQFLEDQMGQKREARAVYRAASQLDVMDSRFLKAVERADTQAEAWEALDKTYEELATAVTQDSRYRAAIIAERARLAETRRADRVRATELYRAAFQLDARAPGVLEALKRLHYAQGQFHDLVLTLEQEVLQLGSAQTRALTLLQIADIHFGRLGNHDAALNALQRAHEETPSDLTTLERLSTLFELHQRYEDLIGVLERIEALASGSEERVGLLERMGQICELKLGAAERAIGYYLRALSVDAGYRPVLTALTGLYEIKQQWLPLIDILLKEAEVSGEPQRRAQCYARVGEICEGQLSDAGRAEQYHARALVIVPGYQASFKALVRLYSVSGKFRDLMELYERAVEGANDNETRITYLFKIGRLHEDALSESAQAVHSYQRILSLDAKHVGALHAVQRAAERGGRFKELLQALQTEAALVTDKQVKVQLLGRAAEVAEVHLQDDSAAQELLRSVLEMDAGYLPGLVSLGRLYQRLGRWDDLMAVYRAELKVIAKGPKAAMLLHKIAEVLERLPGRESDAVAGFRAAVEMDPFNQAAHRSLRRKLNELGQWQELVRLLELELSATTEPGERARITASLGDLFENRLGRADRALAAYEQSLGADPSFGPSREGRRRLLAQAGDQKRLVEVLELEADDTSDVGLSIVARLTAASVLRDELKAPRRAVAALESILALAPEHLGALLALEGLYTELAQWEGLVQVQAKLATVSEDAGTSWAALRELARTQETRFATDTEQTRDTFLAILERQPTDLEALLSLERLALKHSDPQLLAQVDAKLLNRTADPSEMALHYTRLGESFEAHGDASALNFYRAALLKAPFDFAAARGISRLAERAADPSLLEEAAEGEARVIQDPSAAALLLLEASRVRQGRRDSEGAVRALLRALELHPSNESVAVTLTHLMLELGAIEPLIVALTGAARSEKDPESASGLWLRVAHLLADHQGDTGGAITALKRVIQAFPKNLEALFSLAEFYARDLQWSEAVARLDDLLRAPPRGALLVASQLKKAEILFEHADEPTSALPSVLAVLKIEPQNRAALRLLLLLQVRSGLTDEAKETGERLLAQSSDAALSAEVFTLLGGVEQKRGDVEAASAHFEHAVALVGTEGEAAAAFRALLNGPRKGPDKSGWSRYAQALIVFLESRPDIQASTRALLELTRVLGDEMRQPDQALLALERGLTQDLSNKDLRSELANRLKQQRQLDRAITEYRSLLDLDAFDGGTWRHLAECFAGTQRHAEALLAMAPLLLLGVANDLEVASLGARNARPAGGASGSLDASVLGALDRFGAEVPALLLASATVESLPKLYPADLGKYGVGSRERLGSRSGHPIRALAERISDVLQAGEFELYLAPQYTGGVALEFTDPISIVLPGAFAELSEPARAFALGRVLINVARRIPLAGKLSPQEIEVYFAAAARNADPNFGRGVAGEEFLNAQAKKIHKAVSWGKRRALEDSARLYSKSAAGDVANWADAVNVAGARGALLLADDLPASIDYLRRTEGDLSGRPEAEAARGMALASDLMRFWISDTAVSLRQRMGVLA